MHNWKRGFTLVELSFSLAFIASLSLALVVITLNLTSSYQRGLVLKQVNTTGSSLISDFKAAIANSSAKNITDVCTIKYETNSTGQNACRNDGAYSFVHVERSAKVKIGKENTPGYKEVSDVPVFGAFCSGSYSYIWNSGYLLDSESYTVEGTTAASFKYTIANEDYTSGTEKTISNFRLLKIVDPSRAVCASAIDSSSAADVANKPYRTAAELKANKISNNFEVNPSVYGYISEEPIDILATSGNNELALYNLTIDLPAQDSTSRNIFYSGSFILATILGGIDIKADGNYCATPSGYDIEYFDYCAINKFNFAIRASGE
jgi:Tfp pilus assembly protein PilE